MLAALVVAAVTVRGVYFHQLNAGPLIELHRLSQSDMSYYDAWGRQIAEGDWSSAAVRLPLHRWHRDVAEEYLRTHPDERAVVATGPSTTGAPTDIDARVWSRWLGDHEFYQDPLYPYLVGLTYGLIGDNVRFVFVWQLALGVLSTVLIWALTQRVFGDLAAACAGALAVLCAPLLAEELVLLREPTMVCAGLVIVWLTDRVLVRSSAWTAAGLGVALGLACLLKSTFVLLGVGTLAGFLLHGHGSWRALRVPLFALVTGFGVALAPLVVRNETVGVAPFALASSGGLTFIVSNHVAFDPAVGFAVDVPRVAQLMGETAGRTVPAILATLRSHTLASYALLVWQKWHAVWSWVEIPNNENFYYLQLRVPVLAWLPIRFGVIAPLALVGLGLGVRRWARAWPLYVLVAASLLPLLLFYVLGRFRLPLMAALLPFAAWTIVEVGRAVETRHWRRSVAVAVAIGTVAVWTGQPVDGQPAVRPIDWLNPWSIRYEAAAHAAEQGRDPARVAAAYVDFLQYEPEETQLQFPRDRPVLQIFGTLHAAAAVHLRESGQTALAQVHGAKAVALLKQLVQMEPGNGDAEGYLADALLEEQAYAEALTHYQRHLQAAPQDVAAWVRAGGALMSIGRTDAAVSAFQRAVSIDPQNNEAQLRLAMALLDRGDAPNARAHAAQAAALAPNDALTHDVLGRAWAAQGRLAEARAEFARALQLDPANAEARADLARLAP